MCEKKRFRFQRNKTPDARHGNVERQIAGTPEVQEAAVVVVLRVVLVDVEVPSVKQAKGRRVEKGKHNRSASRGQGMRRVPREARRNSREKTCRGKKHLEGKNIKAKNQKQQDQKPKTSRPKTKNIKHRARCCFACSMSYWGSPYPR